MIKINLLPRKAASVNRPAPHNRPKGSSITISRRSVEQWSQGFFSINSPFIFMAAQAQPQKSLHELKNEIVETLRAKERYAEADLLVLEKCFDLMIRFHGEETFPFGEKVAIHLLGVARTLCEWGCNPKVASAGLLHLFPLEDLAKEDIDKYVIHLLHRKNALVSHLLLQPEREKISEEEARYLSHMSLMQEGDRDVWLLEAADEFRTLSSASKMDGRTKVLASRAYFVTAANLGLLDLDTLAVKLENIALMRLDKKTHDRIEAIIADANKRDRAKATEHLRVLTDLISGHLDQNNIQHRVEPDVKSPSRALKKLLRGDELTDPSRFRYIVKGTPQLCLKAFEEIAHAMRQLGYTEIESERKNYVAGIKLGKKEWDIGPKKNNYQSIHLHFRGEQYEPLNVQIRTEEMHEVAELGPASHGRFKYQLNGMLDEVRMDEASIMRDALRTSGQRYAGFGDNIYRVIPYPPGNTLKIIDLLFAVGADFGLRAPARVRVERIDPLTGLKETKKLPVFAPLENGDLVLPFKKSRTPSKIRTNQVSSLPALITLGLVRGKTLDPESMKEKSSIAEARGRTALGMEISSLRSELRDRLIDLLRKEGENPDELKIDTLFSLERTASAIGLRTEEGMHLSVGLSRNREDLIARIMNILRASSTAVAYKVLSGQNHADLWIMVSDVPGSTLAVLRLFQDQGFGLVSLSAQRLPGGDYSLIKTRVKVRKKSIEEDMLTLLSRAKDLYANTRPAPSGIQQVRISIHDLRLSRMNIKAIARVAELFQRAGANIISATFPPIRESKSSCSLTATLPAKYFEKFKDTLESELQKLGLKGFRITRL